MNITIVAVGKLKEKYLQQGIEEYVKRLSSYAKLSIVEVADEKAPENLSDAEVIEVKRKEGERILGKINPDAFVVTLEIGGKMLSSEQFAAKLDNLATYGKSKLAFVIGGSLGISDAVQKRSDPRIILFQNDVPTPDDAAGVAGAAIPGIPDCAGRTVS